MGSDVFYDFIRAHIQKQLSTGKTPYTTSPNSVYIYAYFSLGLQKEPAITWEVPTIYDKLYTGCHVFYKLINKKIR